MSTPVLCNTPLDDMINDWLAELLADTPKLILFTNQPTEGVPSTVVGDLTEPTGDWYTQKTLSMSSLYIGPTGVRTLSVNSDSWNYTGADPEETIYGAAVIGATKGLITYWLFPEGVPMGNILNSVVTAVVNLYFPNPVGGANP